MAKEETSSAPSGASKGAESTRNIQELLTQIKVEDQGKKEHKFWDTQPVPRLGQRSGRGYGEGCISSGW